MVSGYAKYPTYIVIPFKDEPEMTKHVAHLCLEDESVDHVLLYDNGSSSETQSALEDLRGNSKIQYVDAAGLGIYAMWNAGWQVALKAEDGNPFNIAFLNNDIHFLPGTIKKMAKVLRRSRAVLATYPDYDRPTSAGVSQGQQPRATQGTKKDGGMCGHMFMTCGEAADTGLPMFDEGYQWWYGDDEFAWGVAQYPALQLRLVGWPCDHLNEATANNGDNDWTNSAKLADSARWQKLHN